MPEPSVAPTNLGTDEISDWLAVDDTEWTGSDGASLARYLKEICSVPLLLQAEEIEWAKRRDEGAALDLGHVLSHRLALRYVLRLAKKRAPRNSRSSR
jgi:hypothetical protein